ncbi:hypothetical protein FRB95_011775 [Tulasnella sp. JGI-2019a]|nr:hypothetical protein FRB95_011775 [Tulasnella sp. JGI-2019a]
MTRSRIIWLQALQRLYSRRFLPPPTRTSQISTPQLEHRATRGWRFLHALADISSAQYKETSFPVLEKDEERTSRLSLEDLHQDTRGIVAVYITPGGQWLSIMLNHKIPSGGGTKIVVAMLVIWDLWRNQRVLKRPFPRPVHFANISMDDKSSGLELIVGFEKVRNEDPYFSAMFVPLPGTSVSGKELTIERLGGIKLARSPRACSVYGDLLAFADRLGNMCFWNWREQSSARIFVVGWPPVKGKIMLLAPHLLAVFNPASSSFAVFMVPPLKSVLPSPASPEPLADDSPPAQELTPVQPPQPLPNQNQNLHMHNHEMTPPAQYPLARFRLPSRGLNICLPSSVRASAYLRRNSSFPEPFLAYFILIQPESPSVLHLGIVPELDAQMEEGGQRASSIASDLSDGEIDLASNVADDGMEPQNPSQPATGTVSPPLPPAPAPSTVNLPQTGSPDLVAVPAPPAIPADGPLPPEMIEPSWLRTLRCTDSTTSETFSSRGRILHVGPMDHSIGIIRATDDQSGRVEIFTSAAMYAKTEAPQATPVPSSSRIRDDDYFRGGMPGNWSVRPRQLAPSLPNFGLILPQPPVTPWMSAGLEYTLNGHGSLLPPIVHRPEAVDPRLLDHRPTSAAGSSEALHVEQTTQPPPQIHPHPESANNLIIPTTASPAPIDQFMPAGSMGLTLPRTSLSNHMSTLRLLPSHQRPSLLSSSSSSRPNSSYASSSRSSYFTPKPTNNTNSSSSSWGAESIRNSTTSPPHVRMGSSIEGDYQYLGYLTDRDIHAATVDDVSGKICLVEVSKDGYDVVVLDYGWDFWKTDASDVRP